MRPYVWIIALATAYVSLCSALFARTWENRKDSDKCFCQLSATIEDCCCTVQDVEKLNSVHINSKANNITRRDYFRFIKLHLKRKCPFWPDYGRCALKDCAVDKCSEAELPETLRFVHNANKYTSPVNSHQKDFCSIDEELLGALNASITAEQRHTFDNWNNFDPNDRFCDSLDENSDEAEWIDLQLNPEQYTGYQGHSAHRIWNAIYQENCFLPVKKIKSYDDFQNLFLSKTCKEKRIFYRIVSGMHASINVHLSYHYPVYSPFSSTPAMEPNPGVFHRRFHPDTTKGQGPYWLKNMYFTYLLVVRAVTKALPFWSDFNFYTGNRKHDIELKQAILDLVKTSESCPSTFDETQMFSSGDEKSQELKEEFRLHFINITKIMDCVGCERCKVWGKLQTTGIATALKILFSGDSLLKIGNRPRKSTLTRTEIVALFQSLTKLSNSLIYVNEFKRKMKRKTY